MPFTRNISAFTPAPENDKLLCAYGQLIALELALKQSGIPGIGYDGHDLPKFLEKLSQSINPATYPAVTAALNTFIVKISNDIQNLTCMYKDGSIKIVSKASYPNMRYTRREGDWGGVSETDDAKIVALLNTGTDIIHFLRSNAAATKVSI